MREQLGPSVGALVVELRIEMDIPLAKVVRALRTTFGVRLTEGASPVYCIEPPAT